MRRLLALAEFAGARDELVGDLVEEVTRGRSLTWIGWQLIGWSASALTMCMRRRARVTPHVVSIAFGVVLLVGARIAPVSHVLEAWLALYFVAGTLSLFADMAMHTVGMRGPATSEAAEAPNIG